MDSTGQGENNPTNTTPKNSLTVAKKTRSKKVLVAVLVIVILLAIILGAVLGTILHSKDSPKHYKLAKYPLILVSFDGFRADYLSRGLTPNLNKFGQAGVQAKFMLSQFPTKTFPNHYTIVTGLYPESHGIVFNSFYDPVLRKRFSMKFSRNPEYWGGEPIWKTAEKNGLKAASYFWVGSEAKGLQPTYFKVYNQSVPAANRIEQVIKWLKLPKEDRPSFITLYFHEPDYTGHVFGPDSKEVNEKIKIVDNIFGDLLAAIDKIKMADLVNLIVVSDHGMAPIKCNKPIFLDKYGVLERDLYWTNLGAVASFNMKRRGEDQKILDKIKCVNDRFKAFNKKDLPKRMHFSTNRRIDHTIVLANPGESVSINSSYAPKICYRGAHGYDNIASDMRSIFMAKGPLLERNKTVSYFANIEIYNLLAELLEIGPAPNNGSRGSLNSLLVNDSRPNILKTAGDGSPFRSDICQFPSDEKLQLRSKCCNCTGCAVHNISVSEVNNILNMSQKEADNFQRIHAPWGLPDGGAGVKGCLMRQPNFVVGYSIHLRIPLWTVHRVNTTAAKSDVNTCFRYDVRLSINQTEICESYSQSKFVMEPLANIGSLLVTNTSALSASTLANIAPQYTNFNKGVWLELKELVREWSLKYQNVHDISGSIFDTDNNGIKDGDELMKTWIGENPNNPAVPTHFYKIVTRCNSKTTSEYIVPGCSGTLEVISFILRNTDEKCEYHKLQEILLFNTARVKDIELLTGTNFFPALPGQLQAELKAFAPVELWL